MSPPSVSEQDPGNRKVVLPVHARGSHGCPVSEAIDVTIHHPVAGSVCSLRQLSAWLMVVACET